MGIHCLPRELRDEIYCHYLREHDGYAYMPRTHRLRCMNGLPINFSLMYTCKLFATEMQALPLKVNTVTFQTFLAGGEHPTSSDEWTSWSRAGRYDFLLDRLDFIREEAFAAAASVFGRDPLH